MPEPRQRITATTRRYVASAEAHAADRRAVIEACLAALRAGVPPTEVAALSPFTAAYIRRLARENGIPPPSHRAMR
ncbi:hypothetical protein ABN028_11830 [Actinopolymorpha sp. B17G11]|uniref:hypothetical protein n=1 Tax=unclassified Actinopolymorpha TaxID=2627063 RepID=UPI0032D9A450